MKTIGTQAFTAFTVLFLIFATAIPLRTGKSTIVSIIADDGKSAHCIRNDTSYAAVVRKKIKKKYVYISASKEIKNLRKAYKRANKKNKKSIKKRIDSIKRSQSICASGFAPTALSPGKVTTTMNFPLSITVSGNDEFGRNLSYELTEPPYHGTLSGVFPNVTYTPERTYTGPDGFKFRVQNGLRSSALSTVEIEVLAHPAEFLPPTQENVLLGLKPTHPRIYDYSNTNRVIALSTQGDPYAQRTIEYSRSIPERTENYPNDPYRNIWFRPLPVHPNPSATSGQLSVPYIPSDLCELYHSDIYKTPQGGFEWAQIDSNGWPIRDQNGAILKKFYTYQEFRPLLKFYATRLMLHLSNPANFPNWGPDRRSEFLDESLFLRPMARAYDCYHDDLTPEERNYIRSAIIRNALEPARKCFFEDNCWWTKTAMNQAPDAIGAIIQGALAVAESEPELSSSLIAKGIERLRNSLQMLNPDGAWHEGPSYFTMTVTGFVNASQSLYNSLGTDFGISDYPGMQTSILSRYYLSGPRGLVWNFSESTLNTEAYNSTQEARRPAWTDGLPLWAMKRYGLPEFGLIEARLFPVFPNFPQLLYYDNTWQAGNIENLPLGKHFTNLPAFSFRSAHHDDAMFIAGKGGLNYYWMGHIQLDIGSFVMEALGVRWAIDLGKETYGQRYVKANPACVDTAANPCPDTDRDANGRPLHFDYYRRGTLGHNTLVFQGKNQEFKDSWIDASLIPDLPKNSFEHFAEGNTSIAILNMRDAYDPNINNSDYKTIHNIKPLHPRPISSLKRGFALIKDSSQPAVVIRDEFELAEPQSVDWQMHTTASYSISGNKVYLSKDGKKLTLEVLTPANPQISVVDLSSLPYPSWFRTNAFPLSACTTPNPPGYCQLPTEPGTKKIVVRDSSGSLVKNFTIALIPDPTGSNISYRHGTVLPLNEWTTSRITTSE
ncbi:heparinase II/III family protein [bacterium]|nr:heparinase II/III family protein [bacterium]